MNRPQISAGNDDSGVTIVQHGAEVHVYRITADQLDSISKGVDQFFLVAASTLIGIFVTLLATLLSINRSNSPSLTGALVAATTLSGVFFLVFAVLVYRERRRHAAEVDRIKNLGG